MKNLRDIINQLGAYRVAEICQLTPKAVYKWRSANALPRTEYTGETHYAKLLAVALGNSVSVERILELGNPKNSLANSTPIPPKQNHKNA